MFSTTVVSPVGRFLLFPFCCTYIALVFFALRPAPGLAQDLSGRPAKIEISAKPLTGTNEQGVKVHVELRDPVNHLAAATKNVEIEIEARTDKGGAEKSTVLIKQGESSATADLSVKTMGLVEVTAKNPQLAEGGTLIELRANRQKPETEPPPAPPPPSFAATLGPPVETGSAGPSVGRQHPGAARAKERPAVELAAPRRESFAAPAAVAAAPVATPAATPIAPAESSVASSWSPVLKLRFYPNRTLRADDTDPATVWASLQGDEGAPVDMQIYIMSDLGPLTPDPIKIAKGERIGNAQLIGNHPGAVHVWYEYSSPEGKVPDPPITINFSHPVWGLNLVPTSPRIGLFESAEIGVELINFHKGMVPSDDERSVYLSLLAGSGEFSSSELKFQPNDSRVVAKFIPTRPGVVKLTVKSPYLQDAVADFTVSMPYLLMGLCAVGSLLGALIAFWTEKPAASWQRIPIGLITGFILYWAFLFGVVHIANFPHAYVVNPFSATILPIFGGWGGTKVITLLLKPLGLEW